MRSEQMSAKYLSVKIRLNKTNVEAAERPAPGKILILRDDLLWRFRCFVTAKNVRTYSVRGRPLGARSEGDIKIGRHGEITADAARTRAKHILGMLAAGQDPRPKRLTVKEREEAQRRNISVAELCDLYLTHDHRKRDVRLPHRRSVDRWFGVYIKPELGPIPARDLDAVHLREFHQNHARHPSTANYMMFLISSVCSFAEPYYRPANSNPCWNLVNGIKKWVVKFYPTEKRERILSNEELQRVAAAIHELQAEGRVTAVEADFFRLKLLTGARSSELYRLKWKDVHLTEHPYFELPEHKTKKKTGKPRRVPLSDAAALVIERQPRVSDLVFWNPGTPEGAGGPRRAAQPLTIRRLEFIWGGQTWSSRYGKKTYKGYTPGIRDRAGLPDVQLHDLRRTTASVGGGAANLNTYALKEILGHSNLEQADAYVYPPMAPLNAAANAIAHNFISSGLIDPTDLIPIQRQGDRVAELERQLKDALAEIERMKRDSGVT
jgi:integrase